MGCQAERMTREPADVDVLILGAGPAGSAAAIECRTRGLRVRLLEQTEFPRFAPGETLHPGAEAILRRLGVWDELQPHLRIRPLGCVVDWDRSRDLHRYGGDTDHPWRGMHLFRSVLDAALLARAVRLGVERWQPCRASEVVARDGRPVAVVTTHGTVTARWIIDATGRHGWLARRLHLPVERHSPRLVAAYGYARTSQRLGDFCEMRADDCGWTWTAQVAPTVTAWVRLTPAADRPDRSWAPGEVARGRPLMATRYANVTWRSVGRPAAPGYFIVGDAAARLDPSRSSGILNALTGGMAAGACIAAAMCHGADEGEACAAYSGHVRAAFVRDVDTLRGHYARLSWWRDGTD